MAFSPDGRLLASSSSSISRDKTIKLWDSQTGKLLRTLTGNAGCGLSVAFSPDGRLLASGGADKTVKLWDLHKGEPLRTLTGHAGHVNSVAFSPDGRLLASGGNVDVVKLWDLQSGEELQSLTGHPGGVSSVAFSPGGSLLASGDGAGLIFRASESDGGTVKLWDPQSGKLLRTLTGHSLYRWFVELGEEMCSNGGV